MHVVQVVDCIGAHEGYRTIEWLTFRQKNKPGKRIKIIISTKSKYKTALILKAIVKKKYPV